MAGGLNQQARNDSLTRFGGGSPGTAPSAWHISLHTADPGDATTIGSEVTGTGYARVAVNAIGGASPAWQITGTNPTVLSNANTVTFAASGAGGWSSGTNITYFGVCSASSGGNLLARGSLASAVSVAGSGVTISFAAGQLVLNAAPT